MPIADLQGNYENRLLGVSAAELSLTTADGHKYIVRHQGVILANKDNIDVKHVYAEVDFAIGSQFIRHALDDSEPIADLQGNKYGRARPAASRTWRLQRYEKQSQRLFTIKCSCLHIFETQTRSRVGNDGWKVVPYLNPWKLLQKVCLRNCQIPHVKIMERPVRLTERSGRCTTAAPELTHFIGCCLFEKAFSYLTGQFKSSATSARFPPVLIILYDDEVPPPSERYRGLRDIHKPFTVISQFSEALLKFYLQDIPPPHPNKAKLSLDNYTRGTAHPVAYTRNRDIVTPLLYTTCTVLLSSIYFHKRERLAMNRTRKQQHATRSTVFLRQAVSGRQLLLRTPVFLHISAVATGSVTYNSYANIHLVRDSSSVSPVDEGTSSHNRKLYYAEVMRRGETNSRLRRRPLPLLPPCFTVLTQCNMFFDPLAIEWCNLNLNLDYIFGTVIPNSISPDFAIIGFSGLLPTMVTNLKTYSRRKGNVVQVQKEKTRHRPIGPYHTGHYPVLYSVHYWPVINQRRAELIVTQPNVLYPLVEQRLHIHASLVLDKKEILKLASLELHSSIVYKMLNIATSELLGFNVPYICPTVSSWYSHVGSFLTDIVRLVTGVNDKICVGIHSHVLPLTKASLARFHVPSPIHTDNTLPPTSSRSKLRSRTVRWPPPKTAGRCTACPNSQNIRAPPTGLDRRCQSSTGFPEEGDKQSSECVGKEEGRIEVGHPLTRITGAGGRFKLPPVTVFLIVVELSVADPPKALYRKMFSPPLIHTVFDTSWRTLDQSYPSLSQQTANAQLISTYSYIRMQEKTIDVSVKCAFTVVFLARNKRVGIKRRIESTKEKTPAHNRIYTVYTLEYLELRSSDMADGWIEERQHRASWPLHVVNKTSSSLLHVVKRLKNHRHTDALLSALLDVAILCSRVFQSFARMINT
ncbi:hypothetical protein PR048_032500 [Dryococelus australis]|uniref:Uncharacterized protein n=1 Tax=Dryococelus australis TaxID=614101 RepID=A0ABQ9G2D6_9NEOP|nr:hypothetical protein PR048_032500 [Dryococelus australis]